MEKLELFSIAVGKVKWLSYEKQLCHPSGDSTVWPVIQELGTHVKEEQSKAQTVNICECSDCIDLDQ